MNPKLSTPRRKDAKIHPDFFAPSLRLCAFALNPKPWRLLITVCAALLLVACGGGKPTRTGGTIPAPQGGGYYQDDGPGERIPDNLDAIPDATPKKEALNRFANRPYSVLGKSYVPMTAIKPFAQTGVASWYGKKFHGQKTAIGETYDMFGMTAAHPTLPLPSYARVRNPANGKQVVVRVNDRGPFHAGRIVDLSYAAAHRLNIIGKGSAKVELTLIVPGQNDQPAPVPAPAPVQVAATPNPLPPAAEPPAYDENEMEALAESLSAEDEQPPTPAPAATTATSTPSPALSFFVQLGAFSDPGNAQTLKSRLARDTGLPESAFVIDQARTISRVRLGPYASRLEAEAVAARIASLLGDKPAVMAR
ncbi:MAG: septal ring lytic transglycosylase RlpA family protein [Zoogloeaceae bacterium]|jgi:rare lipoprotein A|nr:septal ring lytic transglycosylase RlpA family protein [Zoogloeaceae bacterium]